MAQVEKLKRQGDWRFRICAHLIAASCVFLTVGAALLLYLTFELLFGN